MASRHVIEPTKIDENVCAELMEVLEELEKSITVCKIKINQLRDLKRRPRSVAKLFLMEEDLTKNVTELSAAMKIVRQRTSSFLASLRIASGQSRWKWW